MICSDVNKFARMTQRLVSAWIAITICLSGCVSSRPDLFPAQTGETTITIFIISHGWHTGFVVPREEVDPSFLREIVDFESFKFVEIGWGERSFYMSHNPGFFSGVRAALWRNKSVLHLVGFNQHPKVEFINSDVYPIQLTENGFRELIRFIDSSFERMDSPKAERLGPGLYGSSFFYPSNRTFHLFATCNRWTAQGLKAAGTPISTFYVLTAGSVLNQVKDFSIKVSP